MVYGESLKRILVYGGVKQSTKDVPIEGFVDLDFVGCLDTMKSLTSYVFNAYCIAIGWKVSL